MGRRLGEDPAAGLWRVNSTPMAGANPSQFPVPSPSAISYHDGRGMPYHPSPGRSMSVASPQDLPPQYHARFLQQAPMAGSQLPTSPPMGNPAFRHASMDPAVTGGYPAAAMAAPSQPGQMPQGLGLGYGQWVDEQGHPQVAVSGAEGMPGWYPVTSQPGQPQDPNQPYYQPRPGQPNRRQNPQ